MGKLTIDRFKEIKSKLAHIREKYEVLEKNESNAKEEKQKLIEQYLNLQNELLSHDLSSISPKLWEDLLIICDKEHIADFSKTKAYIDFSIVEYSEFVNYKGCKIQKIDQINRIINSDNFDENVIAKNPNMFISNSFEEEIKKKIYSSKLTIEDLFNLSNEQLIELQSKNIRNSFEPNTKHLIDNIGLENAMQLFLISKEDYKMVYDISVMLNSSAQLYIESTKREKFLNDIKSCEVSQIKDMYSSYLKDAIMNEKYGQIDIRKLPEKFVLENSETFLLGESIPEDLRERYYSRKLTWDDIINNIYLFKNIPISNFLSTSSEYFYDFSQFSNFLGDDILQICLSIYPELVNYIIKGNLTSKLCYFALVNDLPKLNKSIDTKEKLINYLAPFFKNHNELVNREQLLLYEPSFFLLDKEQQALINLFGLENIKRFEKETGLFSHQSGSNSRGLEMLKACVTFNNSTSRYELLKDGIDFKYGTLNYEDFLNNLALYIDSMRANGNFYDFPDYDWMEGEFREKHPEIFIAKEAPEKLRKAFYNHSITPHDLYLHKEYIPFLIDKNLSNTITANLKLNVPALAASDGTIVPNSVEFDKEYISRYGNLKYLQLISKYGKILKNLTVDSLNNEIDDEEKIELSIRNAIYKRIITSNIISYEYLKDVPEFTKEHPEIFVDFSNLTSIPNEEREKLGFHYYNKILSFDDIRKYPELVTILKDKELLIAFGNKTSYRSYTFQLDDKGVMSTSSCNNKHSDLELLNIYGKEKFLELCRKYGRYLNGIVNLLAQDTAINDFTEYMEPIKNSNNREVDLNKVTKRIEKIILREILTGKMDYHPDDAPDFLKEKHPELFLNEDAPEELKKYFYNKNDNHPLTFTVLKEHQDWLPYLEGKSIMTALLRGTAFKENMLQYFVLFGAKNAIKLGINKNETVTEMIMSDQVTLMKDWYDKTGGKFIPDYVVMQNIRLEDADKFLTSGANWSSLMKIKSFASKPESRDAMLKLAYSFGVFDQDQRGFKKLYDLLTVLPRKIETNKKYIIERIEEQIRFYSQQRVIFERRIKIDLDGNIIPMTEEEKEEAYNEMLAYVKNNNYNALYDLLKSLKEENLDIDFSQNIFSQIYIKNDDGSYSLNINEQRYPKTAQAIREILSNPNELSILTPSKAHRYFGGFKLEYDPDFREFFLSNYDQIMNNSQYLSKISVIQNRFKEIKAVYSNVNLTLDLAISYLDSNKYVNVNVGNERVTQAAALQNYSQTDFETLQKIYNYGKQRVFSSIPRIESECIIELPSGNYSYEILRLDDPRAMSIGFESDCCQRLGEPAEVCMEHSMVDKNGRVFIVTNDKGEVVAQSWVWRNKDVLCFDNIEIPDQKMWDNGVSRGLEDSGIRNQFTDDILTIYKMAAHELMDKDEKAYRELLESGKITKEQYDGLRLGKITTGEGYSNIKGSIETLPIDENPKLTRPIPFKEPVRLNRGLYISDSSTQYIIEERKDRKEYIGETITVHHDDYIEYSDSNFDEIALLTLGKLEIVTKGDSECLDNYVNKDSEEKHLVTQIARDYGLNSKTTKIVMNPNFAIIYDVNDDVVRIADLLFNTKVDNNKQQMDIENIVVMQIRLALEQISKDKKINTSLLDKKQKEMYDKVMGLTDELDIERGVGNARKN
ncbi:MAG: hypothetical protein IJE89_04980 [Bacilli bacterium]|nr:hypothetical protein [Bacilli bacterium]